MTTKLGAALVAAGMTVVAGSARAESVEAKAMEEHLEDLEEEREELEDSRDTRRSTGAMVVGIVFLGAGGFTTLVGAATAAVSQMVGDKDQVVVGGAIAAAGAGSALLIGLPLTIYGSADANVAVELAPGGAALTGRF